MQKRRAQRDGLRPSPSAHGPTASSQCPSQPHGSDSCVHIHSRQRRKSRHHLSKEMQRTYNGTSLARKRNDALTPARGTKPSQRRVL